ncbi:MAG: TetR family transcriptional regulator [Chitinivibrionales bacterium]|nr:TetR family transcriptional regulator [Chitinivibrionales bacterium]MBD3358409.1 TetR family transcriptional regulator [Chitinivibrionales bacterium]
MVDPKVLREKAVREAKRGLILDAARKVFAERGFHETRLEDIAAEAGFSKASLYNYYTDKEAIFLSLATRELERIVEELGKANDPERNSLENIEAMIRVIFATFGEHFAFMLTLATFPAGVACARMHESTHSVLFQKHIEGLKRIPSLFADVLVRGRASGEFCFDEDAADIARYITGIIRSVLLSWRMDRKMGDINKETARIVAFIAHGIGAQTR